MTLVFILIFLCVNIILIINNVQRTLRDSYAATLNQIATQAVTNINEMKLLAEIIVRDGDFTSYNIMNNRNTPGNVVREFANVKQAFSELTSVGLVYRSSPYAEINNTIFSSNGRFSIAEYCMLQGYGGLEPNALRETITTLAEPLFLPLDDRHILYLLPLPVSFISSPGVLLFILSDKALIPEFLSDKTGVAVVDAQGVLLAQRGLSERPGQGGFAVSDNRDKIMMQTELANQNLTLYLLVDRANFNRPLMNAIAISVGLQLFMLAIGVFLSYVLARRNYLPIQLLLSQFKLGNPAGDRINELETLGQTLEHLREERDRLMSETAEETQLGRNRLILSTLQEREPAIHSAYARQFWQAFALAGCAYCVVIILIDDYLRVAARYSGKEQIAVKKTICRMMEENRNIGLAYAMDADRIDAILAVIRGKPAEPVDLAVYLACQDLRKSVQEQFALTITCAIGSAAASVEDLGRSYAASCGAAQIRFFVGRDTIITTDLAKSFEMRNQVLSQESDQVIDSLVQIIRAGQSEDIQATVHKIFTDVMKLMQLDVFNNIFFIITSRISRLVDDLPVEHDEALRGRLDLLYERQFETADEAIRTLTYCCTELSDKLAR
jgi:hypothetical protein